MIEKGKEEQAAYCASADAMYSEIESTLEEKMGRALETAQVQAVKLRDELETGETSGCM